MDEIRIHELSESTELANGDNFVIDNANSRGTKRYSVSEFMKLIPKLVYEWTPMVGYGQDVLVTYEGKLYRNKTDSMAISQTWQGSTVWKETNLNTVLYRMIQSIAPLYDSSMTYQIRQKCTHNYMLYSCKSTTTGTWDSTKWDEVDIVSYIKGTVLSNFTSKRITSGVSEFVEKGEIYIINDYMYKAIVDTQTSPLDMDDWEEVTVESLLTDMADEIEESIEPSIETALALGTASGSIASFTDGSTLPMKKLEVAIEPQQDLHGYDAPWVGGSGKNKLSLENLISDTTQGLQYTANSNGSLTISGTPTRAWNYITNETVVNLPSGNYTLSISKTVNFNVYLAVTLNDDTTYNFIISSGNTSITNNFAQSIKKIRLTLSGMTVNTPINETFFAQLESGTTATSFAPYSNICPISGWSEANVTRCGKNLAVTQSNNTVIGYAKKGQTYTVSFNATNKGANIYKNNISGEQIATGVNPLTFTADEDFNVYFNAWISNFTELQLELGNTATAYEPYNGHTTTISWEDEVGTVYGGKLDVVSGVLTVDKAIVTYDGSETWQMTGGTGYYQFNKNQTDALNSVNAICDKFEKISTTERSQKSGLVSYASDKLMRFSLITVFGISTVEQWKTWLASNNVQVVYELETPQTIQLTPTEVKSLLATNNIFADTGDIIDATYVRNANITINDLIRRIENLENA